jgi:enoyl-CoA hydratase/carnithine racemase
MRDYGRFDGFKVEKQGKIGIVTMNRPESLNRFTVELHRQTEEIFHELAYEDEVNAFILTGSGKAFSAGGDIGMMHEGVFARLTAPEEPIRLVLNLLKIKQPVIAALNGDAIGLGATIALLCDIVVASEKARIGDPHVKVGLVAGDGGCIIWPLLMGLNRAKEMLMTGQLLKAEEARNMGLVNHCVQPDQVMPKAIEIASSLADGPAKAIQWTKMSLNRRLIQDVNLILPTSTAFEYLTMYSEDHKEATAAFLEKRKPKFSGK